MHGQQREALVGLLQRIWGGRFAWKSDAEAALEQGTGTSGGHGLEDVLLENGRLDTWETAAFYHLVQAVVLLVLATRKTWSSGPWLLMTIGILIFSGSLYMLCLTNVGWLGAITPIGGVCLILGWVWTGFSKLAD